MGMDQAALVAVTLALASCSLDPVHEAAVAALGPERPDVPEGQYHRAGQPCGVCHSATGPARTVFTLAGTVFTGEYPRRVGVGGATVDTEDDYGGGTCQAVTNCVGNFFLQADRVIDPCDPKFPVWAGVANPGSSTNDKVMQGHIGREPSCAFCHWDPPSASSPGAVLVDFDAGADFACPVNPVLPGP